MTAKRPSTRPPTEAPGESAGFRATLSETSLFDLIQMECARGGRTVLRIRSGERIGYLYCEEGRIVHAVAGRIEGEAAVFDVLSWREGEFQRCHMPWTRRQTITDGTASLLLRAACALDEGSRPVGVAPEPRPAETSASASTPGSGAHLVPFPDRGRGGAVGPEEVELDGEGLASWVHDPHVWAAIELGSEGDVEHAHGDADSIAPQAAYVVRLGAIVADSLGLEALDAVHVETEDEHQIVFVGDGKVRALRLGACPLLKALRREQRF